MRFEKENHKYFTLLEHLEDGPEGVGARITRITPRLRLDVTLQIPFTSFRAGMPGISMPGGTALSFRSKSSFIIRA